MSDTPEFETSRMDCGVCPWCGHAEKNSDLFNNGREGVSDALCLACEGIYTVRRHAIYTTWKKEGDDLGQSRIRNLPSPAEEYARNIERARLMSDDYWANLAGDVKPAKNKETEK